MAGWDTSRYLTLFVGEATEHLDALSKDLVLLEQGASAPVLESMFRHAHSVKGMAASMSFDATAQLAHRLEDLLHALRTDVSKVDKPLGDLVLQTVDVLASHVRAAATGQPMVDVGPLVAKLSGLTQTLIPSAPVIAPAGAAQPPPPPAPPSSPADATPSTPGDPSLPPRFAIKLRIAAGSTQPGVRGFLAYKRLSLVGNVFDCKPPLEEVKAGRVPGGVITLELETEQDQASVTKTLKTVGDVELESIAPVAPRARPAAPVQPEPEAPRVIGQELGRTVRVRTELLDQFLDAAGELLLATARIREVGKSLPEQNRPPLDEAVDRLHGLVRGLHDRVMQARMTPISVITDRLPRAARDISRRRGREVELLITGSEIELDRAIVDELADPVLHLLRNAIDHGVEPPEERRIRGKPARGTVKVTVRRLRDRVALEVEDDGRGMDAERLRAAAVERGLLTTEQAKALSERDALLLSCLPGVSTASDVTDISGRGVGMDAVKRAIEAVGGTLELDSHRGKGTKVRLTLPLTVAMVNLLLVSVGDDVYGLPIGKVSGVVELPPSALEHSTLAPVLHFNATVVPVHELGVLLSVPVSAKFEDGRATPFVVVDSDDGPLALGVDRLLGQQELVLKALSRPLDLVPGLAGVTILGNGRPVFVLDVARLVMA